MITQYSLTDSAWTPISAAGQSGTCWIDQDDDGAGGTAEVRIWHGTSAPDASKFTEGVQVYKPKANNDVMVLSADSANDIFYARCATGATATITADVS